MYKDYLYFSFYEENIALIYIMSSLLLFIIITFLAGLYFCTKPRGNVEGFEKVAPNKVRCPNLLIQKGSAIYLYNTKIAEVPGVNPVRFENLEDYVEFLQWQQSQGIRCPVLFLQQTYDAQGHEIYKIRPSPTDPQGGIPPMPAVDVTRKDVKKMVDATRNDAPYNQGSYPAFDASPFYVGVNTPLDALDREVKAAPISPDPMNDNWGGAKYTQSLIDKGYYKGNEVSIRVA